MRKKLCLALCLCLLGAFNLSAATWWVKAGGAGSMDGTSEANAFATIALAHTASSDGDTINIVGTVVSTAVSNLTRSLSFVGISDGTIIAETTDAATLKRGLFGLYQNKDITFTDLTFSGVTGKTAPGAVINANHATVANVTFTNCNFNSNTVSGGAKNGGAIMFSGTGTGNTLTVTNCTFTNNSSDDGGGAIHVAGDQNLIITNSTFKNNSSTGAGGGGAIEVATLGTINISGCLFEGNSTTLAAADGGALNYNCNNATALLTLTNSTFVNNSTQDRGGAIVLNAGLGDANLTNVTVYNNTTAAASGNAGGIRIQGGTSKTLTFTNCLVYGNNATGGVTNSNFGGNVNSVTTLTNCVTSSGFAFDTVTDSNTSADLTNSNLSFATPSVVFTAPINIADDTPIDFGNDMSDIGAWDSNINLFEGTTDGFWFVATNWSNGAVPTATDNVAVLSGAPTATIKATEGGVANDLLVSAGATLQIKKGGSLILSGTSTGEISYKRGVTADVDLLKAWHLLSSPVNGETIENLRTVNTFATNGGNLGMSTYNNTAENWTYLTPTSTGPLVNGAGFSSKLAAAGDVTFKGSVGVVDVVVALTNNTNGYNLIGNPYPSYLNSKTFLEDVNNTTAITNSQIWIWDSSANAGAGDYLVKPAGDEFQVAPAQGFFVECAVAGNVTFAVTNQTHQSDTFEKSSPKTSVILSVNDGVNDKFTKISFANNSTLGFDNGYEGEIFSGTPQDFQIYTQLVANNVGKNYQVQSLPNSDLESMVIPVGIKATANKEISFSAEALNLPDGLKVYLEDRVANTYTRLDEEGSTHKVTLTEALDGIGRFYLHTASQALSVNSIDAAVISVYQSNASTIKFVGLQQGNATVSLHTILGKKVLKKSFTTDGVQNINLPQLAAGVYLVKIESAAGKLTKKIILK